MSKTALSLSDDWGTPDEVYNQLCYAYEIYPELDVAASRSNAKCDIFFTEQDDALKGHWTVAGQRCDVWCNPPHSKTKEFVIKAHEEWQEHNINILMIIPANSICTKYAERCIEGSAEYHPIFFRPRFLRDGKPSKDVSRNSYFVVIWRKRE